MELTNSWRESFPPALTSRYVFAETRNAAAVLSATCPDAFNDLIDLLSGFKLTLDKLTTPGGNKSVIARELDTTMRAKGWREARFDQDLTTRLTVFRWPEAPQPEETREVESVNSYGGHKVDNVLGRAALDVEWNPKDGNLDRDLANYVSLYEGGVLDAGVILTRTGDSMRNLVRDLVAQVKAVTVPPDLTKWHERMTRLAADPLGTATTANMTKLVPRLERGDGRGCPILAIAITPECYESPALGVEAEVLRLAQKLSQHPVESDEPVELTST